MKAVIQTITASVNLPLRIGPMAKLAGPWHAYCCYNKCCSQVVRYKKAEKSVCLHTPGNRFPGRLSSQGYCYRATMGRQCDKFQNPRLQSQCSLKRLLSGPCVGHEPIWTGFTRTYTGHSIMPSTNMLKYNTRHSIMPYRSMHKHSTGPNKASQACTCNWCFILQFFKVCATTLLLSK